MSEQKRIELEKGTALLAEKCLHGQLEEDLIARRLTWFSPYMEPRFLRCESTDNVSSVVDALLRITTKLTESYAGDVLFTIQKFQSAVRQGDPFAALLLFRESGVTERAAGFQPGTGTPYVVLHKTYQHSEMDAVQTWLLAYAPGSTPNECFSLLRRVQVMPWKEGFLA